MNYLTDRRSCSTGSIATRASGTPRVSPRAGPWFSSPTLSNTLVHGLASWRVPRTRTSLWISTSTRSSPQRYVAHHLHISSHDTHSSVLQENARTDEQHIQHACGNAHELSTFHLWTIVGEWCPAPTDCARYLNGRGLGARYDGSFPHSYYIGNCAEKTGDVSNYSASYKEFLRKYWEAQVSTFEKVNSDSRICGEQTSDNSCLYRVPDGSNGPGRSRRLTTGLTSPASEMAGSPRTPASVSTPISVAKRRLALARRATCSSTCNNVVVGLYSSYYCTTLQGNIPYWKCKLFSRSGMKALSGRHSSPKRLKQLSNSAWNAVIT